MEGQILWKMKELTELEAIIVTSQKVRVQRIISSYDGIRGSFIAPKRQAMGSIDAVTPKLGTAERSSPDKRGPE